MEKAVDVFSVRLKLRESFTWHTERTDRHKNRGFVCYLLFPYANS